MNGKTMRLFNFFRINGSWQRRLTAEDTEVHRESLFFSVPLCALCGFPNPFKKIIKSLKSIRIGIIGLSIILMIVAAGTACAKDCGNGIAPCECGDVIVSDWTFDRDMTCPTGAHGLTIGADGITIDGAGFKITGSENADVCEWIGEADPEAGYCGILNRGYDNVVITNLEIVNFCTGIGFQGDGKNPVISSVIEDCEIHDNGDAAGSTGTSIHGIHLCYVSKCTIENNRIYNNTGTGEGCGDGGNGIFLYAGSESFTDNVITENEIYNNRKGGFFTKKGLHYAEITGNHIYGNGQGGIILRCVRSNYNLIEGNNASSNYGDGIFIGGENNTIRNNVVCNNTAGFGISLRDSLGDGDGISMGRNFESNNNSLYSNTVCGNEGVDIEVVDKCLGNHGRENTCGETKNYNDEGAAGCSHGCEGETMVTETPTDTATETAASTPGFAAVFAITGVLAIYMMLRMER